MFKCIRIFCRKSDHLIIKNNIRCSSKHTWKEESTSLSFSSALVRPRTSIYWKGLKSESDTKGWNDVDQYRFHSYSLFSRRHQSIANEVPAFHVDFQKLHREEVIFFQVIIKHFNIKMDPEKRWNNVTSEPIDWNKTSRMRDCLSSFWRPQSCVAAHNSRSSARSGGHEKLLVVGIITK